MITAGDVQYEPSQTKVAHISPYVLIMIAGDYGVHSEALGILRDLLKGNPDPEPKNVALIYGGAIQKVFRRQAEDYYLAPLGLNLDTFIAQQKDMDPGFVDRLTGQMQGWKGDDVEAIVIGVRGLQADIWTIDQHGTPTCLNDVGFAAVGIGAWHAKSRLMQAGYRNSFSYGAALTAVYAAKKAAEVAPGVGAATDMHLIFREGAEQIVPETLGKLDQLYGEFCFNRDRQALDSVDKLQQFFAERAKQQVGNDKTTEKFGQNEKADGGNASNAPQGARGDEGEKGT